MILKRSKSINIKPACVLVDVFANAGQGLASIAEIPEVYRRAQVIAFVEHWDVASVVQAIKLGAFGGH
jgi:ActR/RegA family two-component response regulator